MFVNLSNGKSFSGGSLNPEIILPIILMIAIVQTVKLVRNHSSIVKIILVWAFYFYLYKVISLTLFPIGWFDSNSAIHNYPFGMQNMTELNPMKWLSYSKFQIFGNILLLMPLTFIGGIIFPKMRSLSKAVTVSFLVSLLIEISQLTLNYFYLGNRSFDTGDLLLNTIGGLIGYLFLKLFFKVFPAKTVNKILSK
ncbi:VanZ family protein [Xylocopilactobacillus apis]|uniref:VanZ-like domain-containing protein n=1 Tax=Xylocopilactobacillus apis TaxID=2932183 RepID=A0AAU9DP60_9LACO|nr:VanZ family protein [Xylocopilactobacillus apis]BDR56783.1 hypothetical protein KIMC2_13450 [Xylocopilactobacillus apis]